MKSIAIMLQAGDEMLACEVLKALFNLYINSDDTGEKEEKNTDLAVLYKLLLAKCENEDNLRRYAQLLSFQSL